MPASRVTALHSTGDIVTGTKVRARTVHPAFRTCLVTASAATTAIATGAFAKVPYNAAIYDPGKAWSTANNNVVIGIPAVYLFTGAVNFNTNANAGGVVVSLFVNGAESYRGLQWAYAAATAGSYAFPFSFAVAIIKVGDIVDVRLFQNSGANINVNGSAGVPLATWVSVNCIGGI